MNKSSSTNIILNIVTILGFILYSIGIYIETELLNKRWGNSTVDYSIQIFGPLLGVIIVTLIGTIILIISFLISKLKQFTLAINTFLCWFWIFSLYQCAINSFLTFYSMPNEPINMFFKTLWPNFWYPIKELFFIIISIFLTYIWTKRVNNSKLSNLDFIFIVLISIFLLSAVIISQITLINSNSNVYS